MTVVVKEANAAKSREIEVMARAIRALAMDAVQKANSGHPGMPMGMADIAALLWHKHLRHNPSNPLWPERDRFVISNGHGSMLLYALLHLTGYDLPTNEIRNFRQLHSKTPGHPEYGVTAGVETTTGPLGQGISNAVGMAIAEKLLAAEFNRPGFGIVDHFTYVFLGDGCLMEGISHEACSLAGTLGLGKLTAFYDDNGISIDGRVSGWFTDDTPKRFDAYGWHVVPSVDGHDSQAIDRAILAARSVADKPTLICCKTVIGKGSPSKAGTHEVHGAALGDAEVAATRAAIGWPHPPFEIPAEIYKIADARKRGSEFESRWSAKYAKYATLHPELGTELMRRYSGELPTSWPTTVDSLISQVISKAESIATRKASQNTIEVIAKALPELIGGSADLTGSNLTNWSGSTPISAHHAGNYIHYGVREFGMTAIMNGISLHGSFIPYGGTFLTFSDYSRNALRMAALMKIRSIFIFTHDSIGLGEDGPTHQAIEHAASLRYIPHMDVWRPCDGVETAVAWISAVERKHGPSALLLSRQNLTFQPRTSYQVNTIRKGGYVLADTEGEPHAVLIATGSEVALAMAAKEALAKESIRVRVVSMPSTNIYDRQDESYRRSVLPPDVPRVAIEAGVSAFWRQYVGLSGAVIGIDCFGESAAGPALFKHFGFTTERVIEVVKERIMKPSDAGSFAHS